MKEIQLTQGQVAIIDDDDYERVSKFKWFAEKYKNVHGEYIYYAKRSPVVNGEQRSLRLHTFILGKPDKGIEIDHVNLNTLDCRKSNLRYCTHLENMYNRKPRLNCYSKYKGVVWCKRDKRFIVRISFNKKRIHIGSYENEIEAALNYNIAAKIYHGEFARLNIIEKATQ